jgi:hypothetical protein
MTFKIHIIKYIRKPLLPVQTRVILRKALYPKLHNWTSHKVQRPYGHYLRLITTPSVRKNKVTQ